MTEGQRIRFEGDVLKSACLIVVAMCVMIAALAVSKAFQEAAREQTARSSLNITIQTDRLARMDNTSSSPTNQQSPTGQAPTVGRIVHFYPSEGAEPQAGIVIAVKDGKPVINVCNAGGTWSAKTDATEGKGAGQWAWPNRQ